MKIPAERVSVSLTQSPLITGKTKIIYPDVGDDTCVFAYNTDFITAGDGARQGNITGKGMASNQTNANVMALLKGNDVETAFLEKIEGDVPIFHASRCKMLPFEVIVRRRVPGGSSYQKRHPSTPDGHTFSGLLVEFFLKTNNKDWKGNCLKCDDPLMIVKSDNVRLYEPSKEFRDDEPFLSLPKESVFDWVGWKNDMTYMAEEAKRIFLVLEAAWKDAPGGGILEDFKLEFGRRKDNKIVLGDVVDADSWRVSSHTGERLSKQPWRENGDDAEMSGILLKVATITDFFPTYRYCPAA